MIGTLRWRNAGTVLLHFALSHLWTVGGNLNPFCMPMGILVMYLMTFFHAIVDPITSKSCQYGRINQQNLNMIVSFNFIRADSLKFINFFLLLLCFTEVYAFTVAHLYLPIITFDRYNPSNCCSFVLRLGRCVCKKLLSRPTHLYHGLYCSKNISLNVLRLYHKPLSVSPVGML